MKDTTTKEEEDNKMQLLLKRFTWKLENLRRVILAMDSKAENESIRKCLEIGIHEDGLTGTFVCDKINEVMQSTT